MHYYYSIDQIRAAESPLLARLPSGTLMRRAAFALARITAQELINRTGGVYGRRLCAIIGSGNNGGDALWAATFLQHRGIQATAILLDPLKAHREGLKAFQASGGRIVTDIPDQLDIVLDGVVGISGTGPLRPVPAALFDHIDRRKIPIVAVDIPSGVDPMTAAIDGPAVHPAVTVTFGGLKPVHGLGRCGRVELVDIGLELDQPEMVSMDCKDVLACWPQPGPSDDKYTQGLTGILAGSATYPGAAILCAGAAVASRSGMVRYAGSAAEQVVAHWPEIIATSTYTTAGKVQAWVVGPGLGTDSYAQEILEFALSSDLPVLVDADALTLVANNPDLVLRRTSPTILTPHAGEFTRLAGKPPQTDRVNSVRSLAKKLGATVLLKGNVTIIADPQGPVYLNRAQQSWAATAGSGDVLSGIIGALLAAGLPPIKAAAAGAFVHARAAGIAAENPGPRQAPIPASQILAHIHSALAAL